MVSRRQRLQLQAVGLLVASALAAPAIRASPPPRAEDVWTEPRTGMVFVQMPAGRFVMGSPASEPHRQGTERAHDVTLSTPIWLGQFEVTQGQWHTVMGTSPSRFDGDARRPVENVNWFDVQDFLRRLTAASSDSRFRLPSARLRPTPGVCTTCTATCGSGATIRTVHIRRRQ